MSFQFVINNCSSLSINNLKVVATTLTRDGTARAVARGTPPKRFEVVLPDGPRWSEISSDIAALEALDRFTAATITIPYARFPWYYGYTDPGTDDSYNVLCVEFPQWRIFQRDSVAWSGPFVFVENIV